MCLTSLLIADTMKVDGTAFESEPQGSSGFASVALK